MQFMVAMLLYTDKRVSKRMYNSGGNGGTIDLPTQGNTSVFTLHEWLQL